LNVIKRESKNEKGGKIEKYNSKDFFIKFKSKKEYINEKINEREDIDIFGASFKRLLSEFNDSENEKIFQFI
jgi:hypothetical protein